MEVVLVRHTRVNVPKGMCYGQTDVAVADTFEQEAAVTKLNLSRHLPFDQVFSSPLTRARLLAVYCGYKKPVLDDRIMEMSMGVWEMQMFDEIKDPRLDAWYKDYMHLPTPGGESFTMLYQRVATFLDEVKTKPYRRIAVFAHGGVLLCAGLYAGLFTEQETWNNLVDYGGIEKITI
ncbi:alpha-ribazole phosphatase [Prevotella aff. ruminicola Tc2-24]|uniref:Alpha-ribazole phosphatase n=1 Tax=Prevotella aff. ruminicola Tc2-24 TaxID=81582 RepID=A0A1I0NH06_9BACT|nr:MULTISPECIES: alpha-ribazole phosphatase [Prevotella]SEE28521.1 alpha-ribazole phosphatase [Prevotella sp. lc2012]SEW00763.1 alpha-ribazole phosphatase [Prevotella aff. ruminicola Tc2-24]